MANSCKIFVVAWTDGLAGFFDFTALNAFLDANPSYRIVNMAMVNYGTISPTLFVLLASGVVATIIPSPVPGGTPFHVSSGVVTFASSVSATLPAAAGLTTYITGFEMTGTGYPGGPTTVTVTVTGIPNPLSYQFVLPQGANVAATPLVVAYFPPIAASAPDTAIVVSATIPNGADTAVINVHGFQI